MNSYHVSKSEFQISETWSYLFIASIKLPYYYITAVLLEIKDWEWRILVKET